MSPDLSRTGWLLALVLTCAGWVAVPWATAWAESDPVLDAFPFVVEVGRPASPASETDRRSDPGIALLPDLPFSLERGYGFVGGTADERRGVKALGGRPDWPLAWREGVEKYIFRLPKGEYLVSLSFVETDVGQPGLRVFDVSGEGSPVFSAVDPTRLVGDFAWVTLRGRVAVYDGWLDLVFSPRADSRPARLSRVRVERWDDALTAARAAVKRTPCVNRLTAVGAPGCNILLWSPRPEPAVDGYGLFRSESPDGPFRRVTSSPIRIPRYVDHHVVAGRTYYYRACVYGVDGTRSTFSSTVEAATRRPEELGLPVYNLRVPLESLRSIAARDAGPVQVDAELAHLGSVYHVDLSLDASLDGWRRKKSFSIEIDRSRSRLFERRSKLSLEAEAGDASFLRALLSQEAHRALGLAAPAASPVVLMMNGRFEGVYLDREHPGVRFRRRARLESRSGLFAEVRRGDHLRSDWHPYGEKIGEPGKIFSLTWFIHELNRLGSGEAGRFLESRLYLDRCLNRLALAAVAGGQGSPIGTYWLEDSRNRKWEWFSPRGTCAEPSGEWGIRDFGAIGEPPTRESVLAALERGTLHGVRRGDASWSVLATRIWNQPSVRERLLDRIESLIADSGPLAPTVVDGFIDKVFATVAEAVRADPHQRLDRFGGGSLTELPSRLKAVYRARVGLLRSAIDEVRQRYATTSVVLNEILLRAGGGPAWVELRNREDTALRLDDYALASGPRQPGVRLSGVIPARGYLKWTLAADAPVGSPSGGALCLYRYDGSSPDGASGGSARRLEDLLYYGHQTEGVSYGREVDDGAWRFLAEATPAAPNEAPVLRPPAYTYRHRASLEEDGSVLLTMLPRVAPGDAAERPAELFLMHRDEGGRDFERVGLRWDETRHLFLIGMKRNEPPRRVDYFFLARSADGVERTYPLASPELTLAIPVLPPLMINEVLPRPDRRGPTSQREFVEIYNPTEKTIDLEGMYLTDRRTLTTKWRIPAGNVVPPQGYLVFYTSGAGPGRNLDFSLRNSGEFLGLFSRLEEGNLAIDTLVFRGVRAGHSWGRTEDGTKSFRAWKDPTPGSRNLPRIPEELLRKPEER